MVGGPPPQVICAWAPQSLRLIVIYHGDGGGAPITMANYHQTETNVPPPRVTGQTTLGGVTPHHYYGKLKSNGKT